MTIKHTIVDAFDGRICKHVYSKEVFDPSKIIAAETIRVERNLRMIDAGIVTEHRDLAGNPFWYATRRNDEESRFYSKGGARLWVELGVR